MRESGLLWSSFLPGYKQQLTLLTKQSKTKNARKKRKIAGQHIVILLHFVSFPYLFFSFCYYDYDPLGQLLTGITQAN